MRLIWTLFLLHAALLTGFCGSEDIPEHQWPRWRGPHDTGVAPQGDPPVTWSENRNVRWKITLPGNGHATPVIWGDKIFVPTAEAHGEIITSTEEDSAEHDHGAHDNAPPAYRHRFIVLAINRRDGTVAWRRQVRDGRPHESTHETGSWASNSPVTDGTHLIASFGSQGLYCLDMAGNIVWENDLGDMRTRHGHGEGSSPTLHGDTLVVNWDHQGASFLVALDKKSGTQKWRVERDEITSWSTPIVVEAGGRAQVIVSATGRVRGYDLATGAVIWETAGLSRNVVASPVAGDGMAFVANSYDAQALLAIDLTAAKGDITSSESIRWRRHRDTPYVPSPLLHDGRLYYLRHYQGLLTCVDAKTGKTHFGPTRLPGIRNVYASPVAAAGRIYILARDGNALVFKAGNRFEPLAQNWLSDNFSASPAIAGNTLYLRGHRHLYAIANDPAD